MAYGNQLTNITNTTATAVVSAPASGQRAVGVLTVYNPDAAAVDVTIDVYKSSTAYVVARETLSQYETFTLELKHILNATDVLRATLSGTPATAVSCVASFNDLTA